MAEGLASVRVLVLGLGLVSALALVLGFRWGSG